MVNRANETRANGHRANGNRADVVAPVLYLTYVKKLLRIIIEILQRISHSVLEIFLILLTIHDFF